jgi:hypothetical protein
MIHTNQAESGTLTSTEVIRKPRSGFKILLRMLYIVSFIVYFYYVVEGFNYYSTPYQARPHHEDYRNLRPAGFRSHAFGIIGSAMMLFMLLYSLRKRVRLFRWMGKLSSWLDIHIYFGIMGPLLIILHTSFKVQGLVAVSFWSMIAVALSGVFGRYLYLQIPRNVAGDELSLREIEKKEEDLNQVLQNEFDLSEEDLGRIEALMPSSFNRSRGLLSIFLIILFSDILRPLKHYRIRKKFAKLFSIPSLHIAQLIKIAERKSLLHRKFVLLNQVQRLFHYWHVFHKPFAIIMYIIMFVHIGVAVWLGYTWVF